MELRVLWDLPFITVTGRRQRRFSHRGGKDRAANARKESKPGLRRVGNTCAAH